MTTQIPEGYRQDARGRLVPEKNIRPHELQRDELVRDLIERIRRTHAELARLKRDLLGDIAAHIALVAENYQVKIGGEKGNVTLTSYDGLMRIQRVESPNLSIGESMLAAEELVLQVLDDIAKHTGEEFRLIANRAFRRNNDGQLNIARLIDMINVKIDDERWRQAVEAVRDAMQINGTTTYVRAYRRADQGLPWQALPLDIAAIAPAEDGKKGPEEAAHA